MCCGQKLVIFEVPKHTKATSSVLPQTTLGELTCQRLPSWRGGCPSPQQPHSHSPPTLVLQLLLERTSLAVLMHTTVTTPCSSFISEVSLLCTRQLLVHVSQHAHVYNMCLCDVLIHSGTVLPAKHSGPDGHLLVT